MRRYPYSRRISTTGLPFAIRGDSLARFSPLLGEPVNLDAEVFADHIVVVDFVFTTCTTVCPVLSAIFRQVRPKNKVLGPTVDDPDGFQRCRRV